MGDGGMVLISSGVIEFPLCLCRDDDAVPRRNYAASDIGNVAVVAVARCKILKLATLRVSLFP